MSATTNFITWGSTTAEDDRFSASNVLLPERHNPRRCLRQPVLLVRATTSKQPPPLPFELAIQRPSRPVANPPPDRLRRRPTPPPRPPEQVSDHNPSPHFITVDNASGASLCSTSAVDPLDPTWLENAPGLQHPMMLAKWDAVSQLSTPYPPVPPPYPPFLNEKF